MFFNISHLQLELQKLSKVTVLIYTRWNNLYKEIDDFGEMIKSSQVSEELS